WTSKLWVLTIFIGLGGSLAKIVMSKSSLRPFVLPWLIWPHKPHRGEERLLVTTWLKELGIIESLFFAPLEKHNVTVELLYAPRVGFNLLDYGFQAGEGSWFVGPDFYVVSTLKS